ncbi:MAG: alpha/beta hydrolase [Ferruginibacter sp.]
MAEKTIIFQGSEIFYRIMGNGKMVMLLHGFAEDGEIWNYQADILKDHFTVIVPDLPGSGKSQSISPADIDTYAEVIKLILDTEQHNLPLTAPGQSSLIGHSMGGYITLAFADKYLQYLRCFGMFHSSAYADNEEKKETRNKAINFINDKGSYAFLKTSIPGLFTKDFAEAYPEKINTLIEKGKQFTPEALIQYYEAMIARPDRTAVLKSFPKPVLFIIGEFDNAIPLQISLQQCYLPEQAHVHILSNSAHMGMLEETEKSSRLLLKFLQHVG